jgi:hypothetical protein
MWEVIWPQEQTRVVRSVVGSLTYHPGGGIQFVLNAAAHFDCRTHAQVLCFTNPLTVHVTCVILV